jgi:hypothetical protein
MSITVYNYKKAILLKGDTKPHKQRIQELGGSWNKKLEGWIFPQSKKEALFSSQLLLVVANEEYTIPTSTEIHDIPTLTEVYDTPKHISTKKKLEPRRLDFGPNNKSAEIIEIMGMLKRVALTLKQVEIMTDEINKKLAEL